MTPQKIRMYLAAVSVTLSLMGCEKKMKDPRTQPELVRIVAVQKSTDGSSSFTGVVLARVQSDLGFRVAGKVTARLVNVGQSVRIGQPLMRIDRTDYANAISTQAGSVAAAKARADQAAADEVRYRGLVATGATSASTYDQVRAGADAAREELSAAMARARVSKDEADYTTISVDFDGTVVDTLAEPGQVVMAGQTVIKLARSGQREASVNLPETVRPAIGSRASATLFGNPSTFQARLRQISDAADSHTRTFEARYVLDGSAASAPIGSTVTIHLNSVQQEGEAIAPLAAIVDRGSGPGVWTLNASSSKVSFRPVHISRLSDEQAYLSTGVSPGDKIVALGGFLLHDGEEVRVIELKGSAR